MNALLDISVLALGHAHSRARGGIFRASQAVLDGLLSHPKVDVRLAAYHAPESESFARAYAARRGPGYRDRLLRSWRFNPLDPYAVLAGWGLLRAVPGRAWRRRPAAREFDVYHSLFYELPPREVVRAKIRLITVYDTIPMLFPDLFEPELVEAFRGQLESIDPQRDWVIAISESTKRDVCKAIGIHPGRVFVAHLAAARHFAPVADPDVIAGVRERHGIPAGPYALTVSTLEPRKNLAHLIRCFCRLVEEDRVGGLNLVLAGLEGWLYAEVIEELARSSRARDQIRLIGYVEDEDLAPLYSGASFFVYPSIYEGFGLPALEAMQCGLPVIASNTSSLPEVVGDAGILVDPHDADGLCNAIQELCRDQERSRKLGRLALERARTFSWSRCVDRVADAYQSSLASAE